MCSARRRLDLPRIEQVLSAGPGVADEEYERRLFLARNEIEKRASERWDPEFYIPSFSHRLIVYKGLLLSPSLGRNSTSDLRDPEYETALAIYHQRYSTNTFPTWPLGQPFRMLAHNGEINTLPRKRAWMHAREAELQSGFLGATNWSSCGRSSSRAAATPPVWTMPLEALVMSGRDILHAMTMLVPPAWARKDDFSWSGRHSTNTTGASTSRGTARLR